uniref:Nucleotide-diphospho-sugar transferase domain-containing protein n=1 Tax=Panagrolaimus sp. PS1159 TaxID=55785 RepID=A0AC35GY99_9BILA
MLLRNLSKIRWSFIFGCFCIYGFAHFLHNYSKNSWLPEIIEDSTLKKKNADGPLILRDDIFDNGGKKKSGVIHGAALMGNIEEFFDAPISKVTQSPPKPIEISKKFLDKFRTMAQNLISNNTEDFILFSVINHAYYNLTSNFLCNIYSIDEKIHSKIFIVSLQQESCKKLKKDWPKISCHWLESDKEHNEGVDWGKQIYVQILTFRAKLLEELAKLSLQFILFESDSIWIKLPFELIKNITAIDDADILVPINGYPGKQKFAFDPLVADGKYFKMGERERKEYKPLIINNNYYVGVKNKSARQALNGLWFLSPKGICNVSKAKKQLAKYQN